MTARHFDPDFLSFFRGLARRNTRQWFHAHKAEYDRYVRAPFSDFVGEMIERVAALDPEARCEPREAIFRVARDTRFAADKTPYKTHASAVIGTDGRKTRAPAFYIQLGAGGVAVAGGLYRPDRERLQRVREAIRDDGATFTRLVARAAFRRVCGGLQGERNVRLPREFVEAAARFPLLYQKEFYYWVEYPDPDVALRHDLADFLMRHYRAARPVMTWLRAAVRATSRTRG